MLNFFDDLMDLHQEAFRRLQAGLEDWFLGLFVRFAFASVLLLYYWNSALLKVIDPAKGAEGWLDYLTVRDNALSQIAPKALEAVEYDANQLGIGYWLMAYLGTYAEFILPALIVLGLFTRLASLGMIGFVAMQTWVDVSGHGSASGIPEKMFDHLSNHVIADQRLLWIVLFVYLAIRGAGAFSLDRALRIT
ncbi:MAG: DoxX family protein [Neomegalonema sp.]|nr:DoxX family protein [Neomegalonema sp.]